MEGLGGDLSYRFSWAEPLAITTTEKHGGFRRSKCRYDRSRSARTGAFFKTSKLGDTNVVRWVYFVA